MSAKLAIVSAWVGEQPSVIPKVIANHKDFARRQRYDYLFFDDTTLPDKKNLVQGAGDAHWIKPEVIARALEDYDLVFWTDLDSVFHGPDVGFDDLVSTGKSFVFTGDHNDVFNGGHLFFKRSGFTAEFLTSWRGFQTLPFPPLGTTQQGPHGHVGDQIAMNVLLAGGVPSQEDVDQNSRHLFNLTNGWEGNPHRVNQDFSRLFAPTRKRNLKRTTQLIAEKLRPSVEVVVQHRLNAYPWWGPKGKRNKKGPIIHFVSPYKDLLDSYFS